MKICMKKTISLLLSVSLLAGMMTAFAATVHAEENGTLNVSVTSNVPGLFEDSTTSVNQTTDRLTVSYYINVPDYNLVNWDWTLEYDCQKLHLTGEEGVNWETVEVDDEEVTHYKFLRFLGEGRYKAINNASLVTNLDPISYRDSNTKKAVTCNGSKTSGLDTNADTKRVFVTATFDVLDWSGSANVNLKVRTLGMRQKDIPASSPQYVEPICLVFTVGGVTTVDDSLSIPSYASTLYVEDSSLSIIGSKVNLTESISLLPCVPVSNVGTCEELYMEVSGGRLQGVTYVTDPAQEVIYGQGNCYLFEYRGIYPQLAVETYQFRLVARKNGALYRGPVYSESVKSYASRLLANNSVSANIKTLVMNLLKYAEEAQKYKAQNTGTTISPTNLALYGLDSYLSYLTTTVPEAAAAETTKTGEAVNVTWASSSSVKLESTVVFALDFDIADESDVSDYYVKVTKGSSTNATEIHALIAKGGTKYGIEYNSVYAQQMRVPMHFTVYKGDQVVSQTFSFSVENFVAAIRAAAESNPSAYGGMLDLLNAALNYGDAAMAMI